MFVGWARRFGVFVLILIEFGNKTEPLTIERPDDAVLLAGFSERASQFIHCRGERTIRHDSALPDGAKDFVFCYDAIPIFEKKLKQLERTGLQLHSGPATAYFHGLRFDLDVGKSTDHLSPQVFHGPSVSVTLLLGADYC
ncbi:MAG: hypothetical protein AAF479_11980 [Pseudomonadota bacterium]